jgi:hypothetical protein
LDHKIQQDSSYHQKINAGLLHAIKKELVKQVTVLIAHIHYLTELPGQVCKLPGFDINGSVLVSFDDGLVVFNPDPEISGIFLG